MGKITFKKSVQEIEGFIKRLHKKRTANKVNNQFHIIRKTIATSTSGREYDRLMDMIHLEYDMIGAEREMGYDVLGGQSITDVLNKIRTA